MLWLLAQDDAVSPQQGLWNALFMGVFFIAVLVAIIWWLRR